MARSAFGSKVLSETENQDGSPDVGGRPVPYARVDAVKSFWRAIAGGSVLALVAALFVALGVSSRDYSKAVADNLRDVADQWNTNFGKLADRVYDLEKWAWSRGKRK